MKIMNDCFIILITEKNKNTVFSNVRVKERDDGVDPED